MKSDSTYLRHILEAVEKIEQYLSGTTYESFIHNDMMIDAVKCLSFLGFFKSLLLQVL